jgi:hypothetical protein
MKFFRIDVQNIGEILLSLIMLVAASAKLSNIAGFQASLETFDIFPKQGIPILAYWVTLLELMTGLIILIKGKELVGLLLSCFLTWGFVISLSYGILTNSIYECGCFGDWELAKVSPQVALLRASIMLGLSLLLTTNLIKELIQPKKNEQEK